MENNIHAGVKSPHCAACWTQISRTTRSTPINKTLLTFRSLQDAGPGRVRALRREAAKRGLDPNVWFGNVEQVASDRVGRETVPLREQYLQVPRRVSPADRAAGTTQRGESAARKEPVTQVERTHPIPEFGQPPDGPP